MKAFLPVFCVALAIAGSGFAQEKSGEGAMTLSKKTYQLKSAIAYEKTVGDEEQVVVVLTGAPVTGAKLKNALATEKSGGFAEFPSPYLKIYFKKDGDSCAIGPELVAAQPWLGVLMGRAN